MSPETSTQRHFRLSQRGTRKLFESYLNGLNANSEHQPLIFNLQKEEDMLDFRAFLDKNDTVAFDSVFLNLTKLYSRFHPQDKKFTGENAFASLGFRNWLRENDLTGPLLYSQHRQVLPHGLNSRGNMVWDVISVLSPELQRKLQEASINKMIDEKTQKTLHDDVELFVIGASVGSNIAATLVPALGIEHVTIVDPKAQDGVGSSRVANPSALIHGKSKAIALWHNLLEVSPYLKCRAFPAGLEPENVNEVLRGTMPQNQKRFMVFIEETDNLETKDLLRKYVIENLADQKVLLMSFADTGISSISGVIEKPSDPPYNGNALRYGKDPYAKDKNPIVKIMETYGLVTASTSNPKPEDIKIPTELLGSLGRLFAGEVGSFEQSGLASRLAGPVAGQILISFLEGTLAVKEVNINLAKVVDGKWRSGKYVKEVYKAVRGFQNKLGIKKLKKKG